MEELREEEGSLLREGHFHCKDFNFFERILPLRHKVSKEKAIATFYHYGISPWEIEVIYDTLTRSFEVEEKQMQPDDPQYVSMIEICFPIPYDESFFQTFSMESWFKIKGVIKDVKRRRGKKGIKAFIRFVGLGKDSDGDDNNKNNVELVFPLLSKGDRTFEMGIEKIEYLVDIVPLQLKSVPEKTEEVWYAYDETSYKWIPSVAKSNEINYIFKNNEWKTR